LSLGYNREFDFCHYLDIPSFLSLARYVPQAGISKVRVVCFSGIHFDNKPNPILQRPYQRQAPDLDKISYGFALLADINMETILSFTKDKFLQGQSVVVEFLIPQNFIMTADVTYCHHYAMRSRIISSTKPDYRLQCRYSFAIPGERENLRKFLKSIEPDLTQIGKKSGPAADDDSLGI
jgi:hypothetical protein